MVACSSPKRWTTASLQAYINDLKSSGQDVPQLEVALHNKIAYPVISLVMALVALPFAFRLWPPGSTLRHRLVAGTRRDPDDLPEHLRGTGRERHPAADRRGLEPERDLCRVLALSVPRRPDLGVQPAALGLKDRWNNSNPTAGQASKVRAEEAMSDIAPFANVNPEARKVAYTRPSKELYCLRASTWSRASQVKPSPVRPK